MYPYESHIFLMTCAFFVSDNLTICMAGSLGTCKSEFLCRRNYDDKCATVIYSGRWQSIWCVTLSLLHVF